MIQRNLQASVITVRTDRGTEFLNQTLNAFFKEEGIEHQTSTARSPEQNGVDERRNQEEHLPDDEFTNPFCASAQEVAEPSSHNIGNSNVSTFNQPIQVFSNLSDGHENGISQWSTEGG
nr:putative RNA-directed DNA polymerase [Tanacetum cinerariifolium]